MTEWQIIVGFVVAGVLYYVLRRVAVGQEARRAALASSVGVATQAGAGGDGTVTLRAPIAALLLCLGIGFLVARAAGRRAKVPAGLLAVALVMRDRPSDLGLRPYGDTSTDPLAAPAPRRRANFSARFSFCV